MVSNEERQPKSNLVCYRCGRVITPDEKMVTVSVSLEAPRQDGSIECTESSAVSSLCFSCAAVLITKAVASDDSLMMPPAENEEPIEEEETDIKEGGIDVLVDSIPDARRARASLEVHCSEEGFYLTLRCYDGFSYARSQLFTWQQIAQILIAAEPDMFGAIDEPLHRVFPHTLKLMGYNIPNWRE